MKRPLCPLVQRLPALALVFFLVPLPAAEVTVVVGWGHNGFGQLDIPPGLTNVIDIAAGDFHSLAVKSDGTVVAWGGQEFYGQTKVPPGLSNVVAVGGGNTHSVALKADGTVVAWRNNDNGQTNVPPGLTNVVAIAVGSLHNLALKNDGTIVAWGRTANGQCNVPAGLTDVAAIGAGEYHSMCLRSNGVILAWGYPNAAITVPPDLTNAIAISCHLGQHNLALRRDTSAVEFGTFPGGPAGYQPFPAGLSGVQSISTGSRHSAALLGDGSAILWGRNVDGQCSVPPGMDRLLKVACGGDHTLAIRSVLSPTVSSQPTNLTLLLGSSITLSLSHSGSAPMSFQWLKDSVPIPGATSPTFFLPSISAANAGFYSVMLSNIAGADSNLVAHITVNMPPTIQQQPTNTVVCAGDPLIMTVQATGIPAPSFQWFLNGTNLPGAVGTALTVPHVDQTSAGFYSVVVSNIAGIATSAPAAVTVPIRLFFQNTNAIAIHDASVAAPYPSQICVTGVTGAVYRLAVSLLNLSHPYPEDIDCLLVGPNGGSLVLMSDAGSYWPLSGETIQFDPTSSVPLPQNSPILEGASYRVTNYGDDDRFPDPAPNGPHLAGLSSFHLAVDDGTWSLFVVDDTASGDGTINGGWQIQYTVVDVPKVAQQPSVVSVVAGEDLTLSVVATGSQPMVYQWRHGGANVINGPRVRGADTTSLTIANISETDAGTYSLSISNLLGWYPGSPISVVVFPSKISNGIAGADGSFAFDIQAPSNTEFEIQASTDLMFWRSIGILTNSDGQSHFIDPVSTNIPARFYRTIKLP